MLDGAAAAGMAGIDEWRWWGVVGVVLQGRGPRARARTRGHLLFDLHSKRRVSFLAMYRAGLGTGILRLDRRAHGSIANFIREFDVTKDLVNVRSRAAIIITLAAKIAVHFIASLGVERNK